MENFRSNFRTTRHRGIPFRLSLLVGCSALALSLVTSVQNLAAREKNAIQWGMGFSANVPFSEEEVSRVVQEIVRNGIIRGTREYSKDEFISGAEAATSTGVFPAWTEGGKIFYKVRFNALDPQNFKNNGNTGTLAVRYVVQPQDDKHTVLRIDARFVDDFRHAAHASNGSVESAEYEGIHNRLDSLALMKAEAAEAQTGKQESSSKKQEIAFNNEPATLLTKPVLATEIHQPPAPPPQITEEKTTPVSLEQRVHDLKQQVERIVKSPGAPLKAAPFHSSSTLQPLKTGTEVLIVISTPYWYGVETHEGLHGWILRDQLEMLP